MNFDFEQEKKKEKHKKMIQEAIRWAIEIGVVIFIAFLIVTFCLMKNSMTGSAMEDTLENGQDVIINKAAYLIWGPGRNDTIAFYQISDETNEDAENALITIRRVIGLPGETIQIKKGKLYIDGEEKTEKYPYQVMTSGGLADNKITLKDDEYFVLGDNRNNSEDSRFRSFGNVKRENIVGRVIFKLDPFSMVGGPSKDNKTEGGGNS